MDSDAPEPSSHHSKKETWIHTLILSFQSLGVVYGRLSIAPLFAFGTIEEKHVKPDEGMYGHFSFVFWTLTIIPLIKFAIIVLKADDDGEGGPFALYSILCRHAKVGLMPCERSDNELLNCELETHLIGKVGSRARRAIEKHKSGHYLMLAMALFGACMMICDGAFTPALSVLSASSGIGRSFSGASSESSSSEVREDSMVEDFKKYLPVPSACAILVCLFMLQQYGTRKIGFLFAPIVTVWLLFIAGVGLYNIIHFDHHIFKAVSPAYIYKFVKSIDLGNWRTLGSIVLCIAGSEAMYADLGHFSRRSIKITFLCLIYPALVLSYAGQAAFISRNLGKIGDVTHLSQSIPRSVHHLFLVLSLLASAVGSQATITATFSIINQCSALGCFPRVKVIHTSDKIHGQVYIPDVNWILMVLSLTVTIGLRDIAAIGYATGLAIISGMLVTTCLMSLVIALYWEKSILVSMCFLLFFGSIETMYLSAFLLNLHKGSWYLAVLLAVLMNLMLAWHYGMMKKYEYEINNKVSMDWLTALSPGLGVSTVPGIGFIYTDILTGVPAFFSHFITNLPAFHQILIFVSFKPLPIPYVSANHRYLIGRVGAKDYRIYRCVVRYGYCDHIRDTDNFEEQIICSIGEFISFEENDLEALTSPEGKMIIVGNPRIEVNALIPVEESNPCVTSPSLEQYAAVVGPSKSSLTPVRRKKVRFMLPSETPQMQVSVRRELQDIVDARESGTAYFLGQSHLSLHEGSNFLKRLLIWTYIFLDKNCREPPVALNIPHAALVEVGMVYII